MHNQIHTNFNQTLGQRLRAARTFRGLAISELARRTIITTRRLRRIEKGIASLTVEELELLAEVLRLPPAHFVDDCVFCGAGNNSESCDESSTGWFA